VVIKAVIERAARLLFFEVHILKDQPGNLQVVERIR
jgi:hypothetical protein